MLCVGMVLHPLKIHIVLCKGNQIALLLNAVLTCSCFLSLIIISHSFKRVILKMILFWVSFCRCGPQHRQWNPLTKFHKHLTAEEEIKICMPSYFELYAQEKWKFCIKKFAYWGSRIQKGPLHHSCTPLQRCSQHTSNMCSRSSCSFGKAVSEGNFLECCLSQNDSFLDSELI